MRIGLVAIAAGLLAGTVGMSSCRDDGDHDSDGPPEWVKVGQDTDSLTVYLSTARAENVGGHLRARLMVFYRTAHHGLSNQPFTISIRQVDYDCVNHRWAMRSEVAVDRRQTDTLERFVDSTLEWHADSEGSNGRLVAQTVCAGGRTNVGT